MVWTRQLSCCESSILLSVLIHEPFRRVQVCPGHWGIDNCIISSIDITRSFWKPATKSRSSCPLCRLQYVDLNSRWVGYLTTTLQLTTIVVKGSRHRAMTTPSPRCRKTKVFTDWHYSYCLPRIGWRFADGDGCRSKEPINVSNVPFPIFSARFLCGNGAPLFFTCIDNAVLLLVGSANLGYRRLLSSRPMDFNKRREKPLIAHWRISRSWIALPHIFLNNRTSLEKPVWATSAYNPGKYGNNPISCRPKQG
jgi:hypothetical protein